MANILTLKRQTSVDTVEENGNELTAQVPWLMTLDVPSNAVQALTALNSGGSFFGFPSPDLPQPISHPDNDSLKFVNKTCAHYADQQTKFIIMANYTNDRVSIDNNSNSDPLDLPAAYSFDQIDRSVPVTIDVITGLPIQNSAEKLITGITENNPLQRITIIRNERRFDNDSKFKNTINSVPTKIDGKTYAKGTLKLESITSSKQFDAEDRTYYAITYKVLENPDSFIRKFIDKGNVNLIGNAPGNLVRFSDGSAYLDGEGAFLQPDGEVIILKFNTLVLTNWSGLRL